jgi:hypothetical protein
MSFSRLGYDKCAYDKQLKESVSPLEYMLNPQKFETCNKCRMNLGIVGGSQVSHGKGNIVDIESDLKNITRKNSNCPAQRYAPPCDISKCNSTSGYPCGGGALTGDCLPENVHLKSCQLHDYSHLDFQIPSVDIQFCQSLPLQKTNSNSTSCQ